MHGEYFLSSTTDNDFNGLSMYSSEDLATWKSEGSILPQQASGELGPNRKGERPHIIKCPSTGEFVLYAHAADLTYQADMEVVYATSTTVNGMCAYKGHFTDTSATTPSGSPNPPEWISNQRTWLSQSTWATPVAGCNGTTYVYWWDHWDGNLDTTASGRQNCLATYVFQPLFFTSTKISCRPIWRRGSSTWVPALGRSSSVSLTGGASGSRSQVVASQ